jgi:hypothetical protein
LYATVVWAPAGRRATVITRDREHSRVAAVHARRRWPRSGRLGSSVSRT